MILPIISRNAQVALQAVPKSYREAALGMGSTKWYMIRSVLLPSAIPGILTGVILAMGRIVAESAALLFTAGSLSVLPKSLFGHLFSSGGTLTIQLYLEMAKAHYEQAFVIAFILILIIFSSVCIIKYNYNINIMKSVSNNIEGIQAENNYSITITEHRIDYENKREFIAITEHYYKDNKYKTREFCEKASFDVTNKDTYYYGEINTENRIKIVEDTKMAYKESSNYVYVKKGAFLRELKNAIEIFDVDLGYFNNIFMKGRYQVRMDRYNGKEYYVFKSENNEGYSEIWVVKDSMMIARTVQDIYNNSYTEKDYNIVINSVKDEDLIVPDLEGYKVEEYINNVNAEYLELYKNIRKN